MDALSEQTEIKSELIDSILEQMRRNGLNDARGLECRTVDLETWVHDEISRSLDRARRDDPPIDRSAIDGDRRRATKLADKALTLPWLPPMARRGFETALRALKDAR